MKGQIEGQSVDYSKLALIGNFVVSIGIIMVTAAGSWDITNHILNKPETFFAPPHALLYSGVGTALFGFLVLYVGWLKDSRPPRFQKGLKLAGLGIGLLLAAGPADYLWHSNFGLDGLLSPPHLVLISGMILSSVGAFVNSSRYIKDNNTAVGLLVTVSLVPVWFSVTGLFYSFSLPFSETAYFDFNPHPVFAAAFATSAYPFLISAILVLASSLSHRFGVASIVGASYLGIMSLTAVAPNDSLVDTIPFYWINMIPIILGDVLISKVRTTKMPYLAGAIFGCSFFFMYYPLITYTYNEIFLERVLWPSMTSQVYFEMVPVISPVLICAGAIGGAFGAKFAQKMSQRI